MPEKSEKSSSTPTNSCGQIQRAATSRDMRFLLLFAEANTKKGHEMPDVSLNKETKVLSAARAQSPSTACVSQRDYRTIEGRDCGENPGGRGQMRSRILRRWRVPLPLSLLAVVSILYAGSIYAIYGTLSRTDMPSPDRDQTNRASSHEFLSHLTEVCCLLQLSVADCYSFLVGSNRVPQKTVCTPVCCG